MTPTCYFAGRSELREYHRACQGRLQWHHPVEQDVIKRKFRYGAVWDDGQLRPATRSEAADPMLRPTLRTRRCILTDQRNRIWLCDRHHQFVTNHRIYIPRSAMASVEEFAREFGLLGALERACRSSGLERAEAVDESADLGVLCRARACNVKPYYEEGAITLYHGDAEDLLAKVLPPWGAAVTITDPPYNVGKDYGEHDDDQPLEEYTAWLRRVFALCRAPELVFFSGTRNVLQVPAMLPEGWRFHRMLGWHKREYAGDLWNGGPAMCWEPIVWASTFDKPRFNKLFGWRGRDFLAVNATHGDPFKGSNRHPCPKPQPVMDWLVGLFAQAGEVIVDPFAGTGTTLYAARALGHRAIGIEREERFCKLAVERLAQGVLDFGAAA